MYNVLWNAKQKLTRFFYRLLLYREQYPKRRFTNASCNKVRKKNNKIKVHCASHIMHFFVMDLCFYIILKMKNQTKL